MIPSEMASELYPEISSEISELITDLSRIFSRIPSGMILAFFQEIYIGFHGRRHLDSNNVFPAIPPFPLAISPRQSGASSFRDFFRKSFLDDLSWNPLRDFFQNFLWNSLGDSLGLSQRIFLRFFRELLQHSFINCSRGSFTDC